MTAAVLVAVLVAGGVYLVLQRELLRVIVGFLLLGHAVNVLILAAGGMARREPALLGQHDRAAMADPLPQAFVLTAIVIAFSITVYLLGLLRVGDTDTASGTDRRDGAGAAPDSDIASENTADDGTAVDADDDHTGSTDTGRTDARRVDTDRTDTADGTRA